MLRFYTILMLAAGFMVAPAALYSRPKAQDVKKELVSRSSFVLEASVTQAGASSMPGVPASQETIVARVERIHDKPPAVALQPGQSVTIRLREQGSVPAGTRALFYANGRVFGD